MLGLILIRQIPHPNNFFDFNDNESEREKD